MRTVDCRYTISDERLLAYAKVPLIDRLRWLEELARFTLLWRSAPDADAQDKVRNAAA
ncbi:MAG: hypothetical protein ACHP7B_00125 [Burkholderiales bacterium]|jgi:hypothetical protein